ncbi:cystathionine gamma-synthase [Acidiferrimicrobium sp. IK]|uniref:cystathionine gamma-synthase n=1 Tax=Acidiferrimicrobium sp. IK TaxID=2871700 RepID=UPI0021CAEF9C|nr:cystathionine gamma-synthase [Acidiferrimicrobium sp. IK]MCU4182975.1 cystathionine gamma-synthase [Acidiferrimicrobium sp. IK]
MSELPQAGGESGRDGFETRAIHAGAPHDPVTGAVVPAISLATTFAQSAVGEHRGYEYSRSGNPTRAALEACLADLEGAGHGMAFSSGLAAEHAILSLLGPGDHVIIPGDAYGGTFRLVDRVHQPMGVTYTSARLDSSGVGSDNLAGAWQPTTRMVWVETPSNPLLGVADIAALAEATHARGGILVVDNTFATPYLQQPLALGADIVVHSTTKYLGGHSDVVGGFAATNDHELAERLAFFQNAAGGVPSPFDCFLVLRGVKTLAVRMDRHCASAAAVAGMLEEHPAVSQVLYPGLPGHPGSRVAAHQMRKPGGMVSFVLAGGEPAALEVARSTRLWTLAESLGAVESLIEHPHRMTHASVAASPLAVDPGLLRLSVGLETVSDLIEDLTDALRRAG